MKTKVVFVVCLLFGLMMINAGFNKLFHYMPMPENMPEKAANTFKALMAIGWLMPLVAIVEIVGGLLFIIPKTRALGAIVIFPIMVGIVLYNVFTDTSSMAMAFVFFAVNLYVIFENRSKYSQLLK